MNVFSRIGSAWSALLGKAAPPGNYGAGWGGGSWFSDAFRTRRAPSPHELVDAYKSLVYACVNLNANAVARLPLRLYATTRRGQSRPRCEAKSVSRATALRLKTLGYAARAMAHAERVEEVTEHPLLDALLRVNDDLDHAQLLSYTVMSLDIVGSAYWWPSLGRHRLPEEFWALPPHLVYPQFTSGSMVPDSYLFGGATYAKDTLIRFRRLSARNPYGQGYGPEQAAIEYARLEDTFVSVQDDMLSNGPRPSVIVSHKDPKGTFGTAERSRLEADMNRKGRGGRAGSAFVVDGAVAVTPISYTPTDLGTKELSLYDMERIANCFDVPVSMLRTEDVNRANAEAGLEQHGRHAVEPRCKLIASALTRWTRSLDSTGARGWDRLVWAFDPAVNADRQTEAELHKTYVALGLPLNVALTEAGYDAVDGGDVALVPSGLKPLSSIIGIASADSAPLSDRPKLEGDGSGDGDDASEPKVQDLQAKSGNDRTSDATRLIFEALSPADDRGARTLKNCGTGAGGFQPGNTCARGRGGSAPTVEEPRRRIKPRGEQATPMSAKPARGGRERGRVPDGAAGAIAGALAGGSGVADQRAGRPNAPGQTSSTSSSGISESLRGVWDEFWKVKDRIGSLSREERELALDVVGLALDITGTFEPTPFSDLAGAALTTYRRDYRGAFLTLLGVIPALGDAAKLGKIPAYVKKVKRAIQLARNVRNAKFAALIWPILVRLGKHIDNLDVPLRHLPDSVSRSLRSLRDEIDEFAGLSRKPANRVPVEIPPKLSAGKWEAPSPNSLVSEPRPTRPNQPKVKPQGSRPTQARAGSRPSKPSPKPEASKPNKPDVKPEMEKPTKPDAKPEATEPKSSPTETGGAGVQGPPKPAASAAPHSRGPETGTGPDEVLVRRGRDRESAQRLARHAEAAEAAGTARNGVPYGHGVSVTTPEANARLADKPADSVSTWKSALERAGFPVRHTPTKHEANHHTVQLPKPVTKEVAELFNRVFGRKSKGG